MTTSHAKPDELPSAGGLDADFASLEIVRVEGRLLDAAVSRLVESSSGPDPHHARRFLEYTTQHRVSLEGFWAIMDAAGGVRACVLLVPGAGRTSMVFASRPRRTNEIAPLGRLIEHACKSVDPEAIHLVQTLLDLGDHLEFQAFLAGGFQELATLSYLERSVPRGKHAQHPPVDWPTDVQIRSFEDSLSDVVVDILDATYEDTLDCPGLRGSRQTRDIFEGHRASGRFDPRLWTLVQVAGKWAGVLLLNPSHGHQSIELVYLGLCNWARGRGLGRMLLRHGLRLIHNRPERVISLAVDDANAPAIALYQSEGFRPVLRRRALIRPIVK